MHPRLARLRGTLERNARSARRGLLTLLPRRAVGAVQVPSAVRAGIIEVRGWVYRSNDSLGAVVVSLDGRPVGAAELLPPTPDVVAHVPASRSGECASWRFELDLRHHEQRDLEVGAYAIFAGGLTCELTHAEVHVLAPPPGAVDRPGHGGVVPAGLVHISGWASLRRGLARVEVRVDGHDVGRARPLLGGHPALGEPPDEPLALVASFEHSVEMTGPKGRTAQIEVDLIDRDGRRFPLPAVDLVVDDPVPTPEVDEQRLALLARRVEEITRRHRPGRDGVRLVVFTHRLDLGGGQLYLTELLEQLLAGADVACLVIAGHDGPLRDDLEALGATVHVTEFPFAPAELYEARLLELAPLVLAHDANIAIVNTTIAGIGADLAQRFEIPAIWAIHESFPPNMYWLDAYLPAPPDPHVRIAQLAALDTTAAVVFVAEATRRLYLPGSTNVDRLIVVPSGVALEGIAAYRANADPAKVRFEERIPPDADVILSVATFEPRKAQIALVVAFARLAADFPDAMLVLVGDVDTPYSRLVHRLVDRLGLSERVRLVPIVRDVYHWYAAADIFVLGSDIESMPRTLLEVMAFGVPVAAARAFGVGELVVDGENGVLFDTRDVGALERAIRHLLSAPAAERKRLADAATATVHARHDSSGYARAYRRLLDGLLVDPRARPADLLGQVDELRR